MSVTHSATWNTVRQQQWHYGRPRLPHLQDILLSSIEEENDVVWKAFFLLGQGTQHFQHHCTAHGIITCTWQWHTKYSQYSTVQYSTLTLLVLQYKVIKSSLCMILPIVIFIIPKVQTRSDKIKQMMQLAVLPFWYPCDLEGQGHQNWYKRKSST